MLKNFHRKALPIGLLLSSLLSGCASGPNESYVIYTNNPPHVAFEALQELSEAGDADAQFLLGRMYAYGEGTRQDWTKAIFWYARAAEQNHVCALNNLGNQLKLGINIPKDHPRAFRMVEQAATACFPVAITSLGEMYYLGQAVAVDKEKGLLLFRTALDQGLALGAFDMGRYYTDRNRSDSDRLEGLKWLHVYHLWEKDHPTKTPSASAESMRDYYRNAKNHLAPAHQQQAMRMGAVWYEANKNRLLTPEQILRKCFELPQNNQ
jgi:TPR repeat protein